MRSASRPGRSLPLGKTRYPLYRRLGGPPGPVRTGIRSPDRPARSSVAIPPQLPGPPVCLYMNMNCLFFSNISNIVIILYAYIPYMPVPVAAQSKALVCVRSPAEIVGSNPTEGMDVCCECCVLSGRGLCDKLITRPKESYRLCCVVVCDLETSRMRRP